MRRRKLEIDIERTMFTMRDKTRELEHVKVRLLMVGGGGDEVLHEEALYAPLKERRIEDIEAVRRCLSGFIQGEASAVVYKVFDEMRE